MNKSTLDLFIEVKESWIKLILIIGEKLRLDKLIRFIDKKVSK
ncbi:hypothetical protein [Romboutsia sp. 1001285H_161024_C4]|nr:hypothetical protein [Romboutsia sp. 1001285H_161024_C4]